MDRNDKKAVLIATERKLISFSSSEIVDWHNIQKMYMDIAYRNNLWAACTATHSHDSDDGFIDFRSWLISQGKEVYMNALNDPDTLAEIDIPEGSADFELYGYVASYSYAEKMVLEKEGLKCILSKYNAWLAENSTRLSKFFERYPQKNIGKDQRIADAYIRELSKEYDIYDVINKQPLSKDTVEEIMSEIKLKSDIDSNWSNLDIPKLLPRLYEKYDAGPEKEEGMNFMME